MHQPGAAVDKDIVICSGGMGFDSPAGQIGHSVAYAAMFLRSCVVQTLNRGDGARLHAWA